MKLKVKSNVTNGTCLKRRTYQSKNHAEIFDDMLVFYEDFEYSWDTLTNDQRIFNNGNFFWAHQLANWPLIEFLNINVNGTPTSCLDIGQTPPAIEIQVFNPNDHVAELNSGCLPLGTNKKSHIQITSRPISVDPDGVYQVAFKYKRRVMNNPAFELDAKMKFKHTASQNEQQELTNNRDEPNIWKFYQSERINKPENLQLIFRDETVNLGSGMLLDDVVVMRLN